MKRFTGSDFRDQVATQVSAEQLQGMDAALEAAGVSWEYIAFRARDVVDTAGAVLDTDTERTALFFGYTNGFLHGLGHGMAMGVEDEEGR